MPLHDVKTQDNAQLVRARRRLATNIALAANRKKAKVEEARQLERADRRLAIRFAISDGLTRDAVADELGISKRRVDQILRG